MAHEIYWLRQERVLYVSYKGYQSSATLQACLDDMAAQLDRVSRPVVILINWLEVTASEPHVLKSNPGHRAYSHPMAARGVLVGFDRSEIFENEVTAVKSRGSKNTQYYNTIAEALNYLQYMLADDAAEAGDSQPVQA